MTITDARTITRPEQLTPDLIANTQFATTRAWGIGYDETEVDEFLDLVEARVEQLMRDLDQARRATGRHALTVPEPVDDDLGLLTPAEHRVIDLLGQAWTTLAQEVVEPDRHQHADLTELIGPIHTVQNAVLAQAAARAYPDRYRRLGTSINPEAPDE